MILLRADYHFAFLSVHSSTNLYLEKLNGYVVRDNKHSFQIVSQDGKKRLIPKQSCVFDFSFKQNVIRVFGNNLVGVPQERLRQKHTLKNNFENNLKLIPLP